MAKSDRSEESGEPEESEESEESSTPESPAPAPAPAPAPKPAAAAKESPRSLDALGMTAFALYVIVGGVLVFGFGRALQSAVQTQNETACRALRPFHARVTGQVLDARGKPAAGAEVIPLIGGRGGVPVPVDPEGRFELFMPKGPQGLRVRAPKMETLEAELVLEPSEVVEVDLSLVAEGKTGGALQERRRSSWPAPEFVVQDLEGNEVSRDDLRGKLVVLNFWATWCEPCITEWPQVAKLAERLTAETEVEVLAVSIDQEKPAIAPFLEQMSLLDTDVRVLWDPSAELHKQFGSEKIPDTYVIDEQGQVVTVFVNTREWGSPGALHCVESLAGR